MKLRLSKKTGLFIGLGILVVCLAGFGFLTFNKIEERNQLNVQLALLQTRLKSINLETLTSRSDGLQGQINGIVTEKDDFITVLSIPIISSNYTSSIYNSALAHNLDVSEMTSTSPDLETINAVNLLLVSISVNVTGRISSIVKFENDLRNVVSPAVVKSVYINVPEILRSDNTSLYDTNNSTGTININLYSYRGN